MDGLKNGIFIDFGFIKRFIYGILKMYESVMGSCGI